MMAGRFIHLNRHEIQIIFVLCAAVFFYGSTVWFFRSKTQKPQIKPFASNPLQFYKSDGIISPKLNRSIFLLIFINSIPKNFYRRQTIRETWAKTKSYSTTTKSHSLRVSCVFLIALSENSKTDRNLALTEARKHNDLLQINVQESYRTMIYKIWSGFYWAQSVNPQYIVKADDDVYLSIPRLINWLDSMKCPRELYTGWLKQYGRIIRSPTHRWYVSFHEFSQRFFPPYCIGSLYMFSGDILKRLLGQTAYVETFYVEDAYMGVLMRDIGISALDSWKLFQVAYHGPLIMKRLCKDREFLRNISDAIGIGERLDDKMIRYIHYICNNHSATVT